MHKKIIYVEKKNKVNVTVIKQGSKNRINIAFYKCDLSHLKGTIYRMPNFGTYEDDCTRLLGRHNIT